LNQGVRIYNWKPERVTAKMSAGETSAIADVPALTWQAGKR
jgi:hypothetical protein